MSWLNELKAIGANYYGVPPNEIEISGLTSSSPTIYTYTAPSGMSGKTISAPEQFLFMITHDGFDNQILGYYDATSINTCAVPNGSKFVYGTLEQIAFNTLNVIGADCDTF